VESHFCKEKELTAQNPPKMDPEQEKQIEQIAKEICARGGGRQKSPEEQMSAEKKRRIEEIAREVCGRRNGKQPSSEEQPGSRKTEEVIDISQLCREAQDGRERSSREGRPCTVDEICGTGGQMQQAGQTLQAAQAGQQTCNDPCGTGIHHQSSQPVSNVSTVKPEQQKSAPKETSTTRPEETSTTRPEETSTTRPVKERLGLTLRKKGSHKDQQTTHHDTETEKVQSHYNKSIEECVLYGDETNEQEGRDRDYTSAGQTTEYRDREDKDLFKGLDKQKIEEYCKDVCEGKDHDEGQHGVGHVPTAEDLENAHEEDLDLLEQAIAEKRMQIAAQIEMDHAATKANLQRKIEQLEHARLTQQHNFRSAYYKLQQKLEELNVQYERGLEEHQRELERVATQEKTTTQMVLNKIASVRSERERIAPELGRLDGALQLALSPELDRDEARIERGILLDLTRKLQDTVQNNAADEQQLQNIAIEDMDILMDEINNLEQELAEERQLNEESRQTQTNRLNDLRAQIAKAKSGPVDFDEEKKRLQEEVDALKLHWQTLRGHIEEKLQHTLDKTEKKKAQGRAKLMQQKAELFLERNMLGDLVKEANAKVFEEQKKIDEARQFFEERVKIKTKELNDQEDWHAERMIERTNRRDKRIKDLDMKEQERAKRRTLEIQLLKNKEQKIDELFNIKKGHLNDAIVEAEERIREVEHDLNKPSKEMSKTIAASQCSLTDAVQRKTYLIEEKKLMKNIAKQELDSIQKEAETLRHSYNEQVEDKHKELVAIRHARDKQVKSNEKRLSGLDHKFGKQIEKLAMNNEKLETYIENLGKEVDRLERERAVYKEEYATQQEGIRQAIVEDETHIEKERDRIHQELERDRERHDRAVDDANTKIQDARKNRHELTVQFKKDINDFAARAVGMGPSGSGTPEQRATMLTTYAEQIKEYTKKVQAMNDKIKELMDEYKGKNDEKSKQKRAALAEMKKENDELEKQLKGKQKVVKEGNKLLQIFVNDDHCLYCREKHPSKHQTDQLNWVHEENRRLTEKLADLYKRETEYEKVSSKQIEELRNTLEISTSARPGLEKNAYGHGMRARTDSQSSKSSLISEANI
jgi:hypothetical protein